MSRCTVIRTFWVFFSEKIIVGPQEVQNPRSLLQWTLTHYILGSICFRTPPTPPICLKMPKCAIFSTFWVSGEKNHPKVVVYREKFNNGFFATNFFGSLYIYGRSQTPSPSPESHGLFKNEEFIVLFS